MNKMLAKFEEATARIDSMFFIAGMLGDGETAVSSDLKEFFEDTDFADLEKCFGCALPDWVKEELESGETGGVVEWLSRESKLGFLLQFVTPIMEVTGKNSARYSWGRCTYTWVYGDTLHAALKAGFAFVKEQRKKEKAKFKAGGTA